MFRSRLVVMHRLFRFRYPPFVTPFDKDVQRGGRRLADLLLLHNRECLSITRNIRNNSGPTVEI